jgi:endonuclease YncB( thermonuclease family)
MRGKQSSAHTSAAVWQVEAEILEVLDGDTVRARLSLGWYIEHLATIRVEGIDAPEMPTEAGEAARLFLVALLPIGTRVIVTSKTKPEKYGRTLASLLLVNSGGDVASRLIAAGHAKPYDGGKREP